MNIMANSRPRTGRLVALTFLTVSTLIGASACGGDDSGDTGGDLTLGYVYTKVPAVDFETATDGIDAAVKEINDAGGLDGRKLAVKACNDQGTPDGATTCAQQMISDSSVVAVTAMTLQGAVYTRALKNAGLAYLPALPVQEADASAATLSLTATGEPYAAAAFEYAVQDLGAKRIAPVGAATLSPDQLLTSAQVVADKLGVEVVGGSLQPAAGQADFLPIVARAVDADADAVYAGYLAINEYLPFLQAYKASGADFDIIASGASVTQEIIDGYGDAGVPLYVVSSFGPANSDGPGNVAYQKASAAVDKPVSEFGQFGYAAALAVQTLLEENPDDLTRAGFNKTASAKDLDIAAPAIFQSSFTRPLADVAEYAAFANANVQIGRYVDGIYESVRDEPIDASVYFK